MENRNCKYEPCSIPFEPRKTNQVFCSPKCKAAYHRDHPFEKGVPATVVRSTTNKSGVDIVIRVELGEREKAARLAFPDRMGWFVPMDDTAEE